MDANKFNKIRISLASPEHIRSWSSGEVKKPETINYRTLKPEKDGLFCERIFGPTKDWECHCGKYKRVRYKGVVCDRCGVEVTKSKVRRERMGHIELAAPVSHIWYFKGIPSRMGLLLDISPRSLERVLYFVSYIVTDPGDTPLLKKQIISETEYREFRQKYGAEFKAGMGAENVRNLLADIDLKSESQILREALKTATGQKKIRATRRLDAVESFLNSGNKPEWMVMEVIPVIPPELRPMVQLDGGRFATSDLNDLYRRVINRNNRLKRLMDLMAPNIIVRNEKRMLQEAVDALIDNGRRGRPVAGPGNRPLKSLSDMLKGKQGRFRQNLLGKRVDYSGRSVIVVGPDLSMNECGLPRKMALELFKPYVMKRLVDDGTAHNIKSAKRMVEKGQSEVWDVLEQVAKNHPVLLNRAPTLHRLGIQAFDPVLVDGKAIRLHPLVCTAYNADFDGDQMAVHLPLSLEAQAEARMLMLSVNNILNPKDGKPVSTPTQDMVLGTYYLTVEKDGAKGEGMIFKDYTEAMLAYEFGEVTLHTKVSVKINDHLLETTIGRLIFNFETPIPKELGYYNEEMGKKKLSLLVARCYDALGANATANMLDGIKRLGFKYSTKAGLTISVSDITIPKEKQAILDNTTNEVDKIEAQYRRGLLTEHERYGKVTNLWSDATDEVTKAMMKSLDRFNPVYMMANSGARGNVQQIRQLAGMRGLMADPSGRIMDIPIKANFREGLTVLEYFISTHGARKGLADTALRTADSGYLTRRLVDVSQDVIVRQMDCGTNKGVTVSEIKEKNNVIEMLHERIEGRYALEDIYNEETGKVIIKSNELINSHIADEIVEAGIKSVTIRSVSTCDTEHGVCGRCYGKNLANGQKIELGEAVGTIAAQSIGEPGTQLTMRTFHTGGIAGDDITQGLPRVEELFEARKPKGKALIASSSGRVNIKEMENGKRMAEIISADKSVETHTIPFNARLRVRTGDEITSGDTLTEGSIDPKELLRIKGIRGVQEYILREVQKVYRMQGVDINDKHIEVIARQMTQKVIVEDPGDTDLIMGEQISEQQLKKANKKAKSDGLEEAGAIPLLLGITKASLATDSFFSAASFQETTRVLTEAAIKGKVDPLIGLKENVLIGKLIPAGTGLEHYRSVEIRVEEEEQAVPAVSDYVGEEAASVVDPDSPVLDI